MGDEDDSGTVGDTTVSRTAPVRVALVGPDIEGGAPGGMATISRTIVRGFADSRSVSVVAIPNFDEGSTRRRLVMGLRAALTVVRRRRELDLVHIQVATGLSIERDLVLAIVARSVGLPVVSQFHGAGQIDDYTEGGAVHRWCYRALVRASHDLVLGPVALDWLRTIDPGVRAEIVPNGTDVPRRAPAFPDGVPVFTFVGRLGRRKGTYDLLAAVEQLARDGVAVEVRLLGDGDLDAVRRQVAASPELRDRVVVRGWQPEEEVERDITSAWALVLPSYAEGLPMAIVEAMALGRAVVATGVGEVGSLVVPDVNGLLVEPGDIDGLAGAMRRVRDRRGPGRTNGHRRPRDGDGPVLPRRGDPPVGSRLLLGRGASRCPVS